MPKRVDWYRLNAERCQQLAQTFKDPDAKRTLSVMADSWLMLAAQRVKNIEKARVNGHRAIQNRNSPGAKTD
jgi:hypothetical protein